MPSTPDPLDLRHASFEASLREAPQDEAFFLMPPLGRQLGRLCVGRKVAPLARVPLEVTQVVGVF